MNIDSVYRIGAKFMEFPINLMAEWSKALGYATSRKWSGFKAREHHQGFLIFKFYFKYF